jgi:hypothetical protein
VIGRSKVFKTAKQTQRLRNQLDTYVLPYIGSMQVQDIEQTHLIAMLVNYYERIPDTAARVINHVDKSEVPIDTHWTANVVDTSICRNCGDDHAR